MKLIFNTRTVCEACQNVQRACAQKATMPTLECILFKTTEGGVELSGFDLEIGISTLVEAIVEREGSILLSAKTICEILRHIDSMNVTFELDDKNICTITGDDSEFTLIGLNASEFPDIPMVMGGVPLVFNQPLLRNMIKQTIFAASIDDSKPVHKGIKFEISDNTLLLVALDGFRLALRKENIEYKGEDFTFIIPSSSLQELVKFFRDDGFVSIAIDKSHIIFNIDGYIIVSRLIEGDFLRYRAAIPASHSIFAKVNTTDLIDSVERMSLVITEKIKSPVRCIFEDNSIKLNCSTSIGLANDKIGAEINGERIEIGFNNRFLLDALRACEADEIMIKMDSPSSAVVIEPLEGDSFTYLILPVRLKTE